MQAILQTDCIQYLGEYLVQKRKIESSKGLKTFLNDLWFKLYTRGHKGGDGDSSAFEHVFVGEVKQKDIKGFHNW